MDYRERALIPFSTGELLGERLLVIAPHPDDEVIGCGGLISLHVRDRRSIRTVVVTDGSAGGDPGDASLAETRRKETDAALERLGAPPAIFLAIPDRQAEESVARIAAMIREELLGFTPDLIVMPSPIEIHPDHAAISIAVIELIQQDAELASALRLSRIALMEISQPIRPNLLVDITSVQEDKQEAIRLHRSQIGQRNYDRFARGLNAYRTMTLDGDVQAAEGYYVVGTEWVRTHPLSQLIRDLHGQSAIETSPANLDVSVIVRTRNRPALLREAVASIRASSADAEIVVVNDGGESVESILQGDPKLRLIEFEAKSGRSEAMNRGVEAAGSEWIAFLDDDDLFEPEHLPTLMKAASSGGSVAWYTDAVSVVHERGEDGGTVEKSRDRTYAQDYDASLLLLDNYIPLPTLLIRRSDFLAIKGFDPELDLFEDWDFLIRLSRQGRFTRIPRITCEIRHFVGGDSAILAAPPHSEAYRSAKRRVWEKNSIAPDPELVMNLLESMKNRMAKSHGAMIEREGRARHLELDVIRFQREKEILIAEIMEKSAAHERSAARAEAIEREREEIREALSTLQRAHYDLHAERGRLVYREAELERALADNQQQAAAMTAEIEALNEILNEFRQSRAWKLHQAFQRIRGK
ncbi:MAG TPA: PIG-L family deacetylase [Thermoanaerobaculia bacterium]|nr:PIG-L family deacetylase [Thermoanaerobaculia bacterium]